MAESGKSALPSSGGQSRVASELPGPQRHCKAAMATVAIKTKIGYIILNRTATVGFSGSLKPIGALISTKFAYFWTGTNYVVEPHARTTV